MSWGRSTASEECIFSVHMMPFKKWCILYHSHDLAHPVGRYLDDWNSLPCGPPRTLAASPLGALRAPRKFGQPTSAIFAEFGRPEGHRRSHSVDGNANLAPHTDETPRKCDVSPSTQGAPPRRGGGADGQAKRGRSRGRASLRARSNAQGTNRLRSSSSRAGAK